VYTAAPDPAFDLKVKDICAAYLSAQERAMAGERTISLDEMTGIQALERIVFHFTPKHCSWLNQIEIWFGILMRKLLKRGNFLSQAHLKARILEFVVYFNRTMAKPFQWTYKGKALAA
jgi:hypothetical protein